METKQTENEKILSELESVPTTTKTTTNNKPHFVGNLSSEKDLVFINKFMKLKGEWKLEQDNSVIKRLLTDYYKLKVELERLQQTKHK